MAANESRSLLELPDPVFEDEHVTLYCADSLTLLPLLGGIAATVTDPPYGETSLSWDRRVDGWLDLLPGRSLWCFGSLRSFVATGEAVLEEGRARPRLAIGTCLGLLTGLWILCLLAVLGVWKLWEIVT